MLDTAYKVLRSFLFSLIYPAPTIHNRATRNFIGLQQHVRSNPNYGNLCHQIKFAHNDLDAMIVGKIPGKFIYDLEKKYIIIVGGNTTCYQVFMPEMLDIYHKQKQKAVVIGFNPPGVGLSPGVTNGPEDYCAALESIIDDLLEHEIQARNILIIGHSLGAAIAANTINQYHEKGLPIRLFADRTMMSISEAAGVRIRNLVPTAFLRSTIGSLLYLLMKALVKLLHLELNVADHFVNINRLNPGAAHGMMAQQDEVLAESDLGYGLPPSQLEYFKEFRRKADDTFCKEHSRPRPELVHAEEDLNADEYMHACLEMP